MIWWLKSRRPPALAMAVVAYLLLLALIAETLIPVITFLGPAEMPAAALAPLVVVAGVLAVLAAGDPHQETTALREIWRFDLVLVLATVAVAAGGARLLADLQPFTAQATRNLLGYLGIALLLRLWVSERAAVALTTAVILFAIAFGRRGSALYPWGWPQADGGNLPAALIASLLFAAGLGGLVWSYRSSRRTVRTD